MRSSERVPVRQFGDPANPPPPRRSFADRRFRVSDGPVRLAEAIQGISRPRIHQIQNPTPTRPTEWVFARLMYPPVPPRNGGVELYENRELGGSNWTMDYPRSDRHLSEAVRRLTRIHGRSTEEPNDLDDDDVYNRPWLYGVEVGHWQLTDSQAAAMRRISPARRLLYVRRFPLSGGVEFLRSQHAESLPRPPDRRVSTAIRSSTPFTIWTSATRFPARNTWSLIRLSNMAARLYWRAIYDDRGRIMVAMCFNMDLAIRGSTPTTRNIPPASRIWEFASG